MRAKLIPALLLRTCLALAPLAASAQQFQWVKDANTAPAGRTTTAEPTATAIGPNGEVYTGYNHESGPLNLGSTTLPTTGHIRGDFALARYDASGNFTGTLLTGGGGVVTSIQTDGFGNVYAAGRFQINVTSGTTTLTSAFDGPDLFVGKWDAAGNLLWLKQGVVSTAGVLSADKLVVDYAGRVILAGELNSNFTLGGVTFPQSNGYRTLYCCQLDAAGNVLWRRTANQQLGDVECRGLAVDPISGVITLSGRCSTALFGWGGAPVGDIDNSSYWMQIANADGTLLRSFSDDLIGISGGPYVAAGENGYSYMAFSPFQPTFTLHGIPLSVPAVGYSALVVARLDPNGVPQWVQVFPADPNSNFTLHAIATAPSPILFRGGNGQEAVYLAGSYYSDQPLALGTAVLPTSGITGFDSFVAALDGSSGTSMWALPGGGNNATSITPDDRINCLSVAASGQIAFAGDARSDSMRLGPFQIVYPVGSGALGAFTGKILQSYNVMQGTTYHDVNGNGRADAGETTYPGMIVEASPGGRFFSTDSHGDYRALTDLGPHSVGLPVLPPYHTLVAPPAPATFPSYGNVSTGHDFRLAPIPNQQDLRVALTPVGRARPGFPVRYRLTYRNIGTVAIPAGSFRLAYDSLLTYVSSTPTGTATGHTLTWSYSSLLPGQTRDADILFQLTTTAPLGYALNATATLEPLSGDLTPVDNQETASLTVTGSYDPNDISVNYHTLTEPQVQLGRPLDYTVRFQNMGTDTAFSVLLRDSLPTDLLNLSTLQVLASSHTCIWHLSSAGVLTVEFPNIRLPHRTANTLGSMGFVRFRAVPRTTLVAGNLIPNEAAIHFDFNAPITTNTALTTVVTPTGVTNADQLETDLRVWPNPASGTLNVEAATTTTEPLTLTLLDAVGRVMLTQEAKGAGSGFTRTTLDVRTLPAGLYILQTTAGSQQRSRRVFVR